MRISRALFEKQFIDKVKLLLVSGNGANGNPKLRGKGGDGGSVILEGDSKTKFEDIIRAYPGYSVQAAHGKECSRGKIIGESAENVIIKVPTGIEVHLKSGDILGQINKMKDSMVVSRGGVGGGPLNNYLAKPGETVALALHLKLIADIGLIGFPNAGKSSFLNAVSKMNVKIRNYPFTTLRPQVASMVYDDGRSISMADLPGIIEGAHVNVGLGHHFLKHVERTKALVFVIDIYGFKLSSKNLDGQYRSPMETILLLNHELERFNASLLDKPAICLLNKIDRPEGRYIADFVRSELENDRLKLYMNEEVQPSKLVQFNKIIEISAKDGYGIDDAKLCIRQLLDEVALANQNEEQDSLDQEFQDVLPVHV